jgi:hypothetical protein
MEREGSKMKRDLNYLERTILAHAIVMELTGVLKGVRIRVLPAIRKVAKDMRKNAIDLDNA